MPPRSLTQYEIPIVQLINDLGSAHKYEYAAFLKSADGPLIELRTDMRDDGADPSIVVRRKARQGVKIVVHHNHLSQESLSSADWNGLNKIFHEMFAHCDDGTMYCGRVLNREKVRKVLDNYEKHEIDANNYLFNRIINRPCSSKESMFFRKEVVNRAMRNQGFVEYNFSWGSHHIGASLNNYLEDAAKQLAPGL